MLCLPDEFIRRELSMATVIDLVESAFAADARGDAVTFPAIVDYVGSARAHFGLKSGYLRLPTHADSGADESDGRAFDEVLGLKAGGYWMSNQEHYGLPSHRATLLLIDPLNGEPLTVMPANTITRLRTAAAGAVAARYLARGNSKTVTVIGTGEQAHAQLEALRITHRINKVFVWGRRRAALESYVSVWRSAGLETYISEHLEEDLPQSDIIITTTPATSPLVLDAWVSPGTHINAVGSDGAGKKELDPELVRRSKFVADKSSQSHTIGELQQVPPRGDGRELLYAELGEVCSGTKPGRQTDSEITIFDSSGVSFQDLVVAHYLFRQAVKQKVGTTV